MTALAPVCLVCPVLGLPELWRPVHREDLPGYSISTHGRVRNDRTGRLLAIRDHPTGYRTVTITRRGRQLYVHRLVAFAWIGPPPADGRAWEVDHLDFDRHHNAVPNLRWLPKDTNAWRWKFWTTEAPELEQQEADRRWTEALARGYAPDWTEEPRGLISTPRRSA